MGVLTVLGADISYHRHEAPVGSYLIQGPSAAVVAAAVAHARGKVTHDLPIINGLAADLTAAGLAELEQNKNLRITANRAVAVKGTPPPEVQPYVVERTGASQLHAQGITGKGITIAFLDTGWWNQHATQTNIAGQNVVLQGYDAIGNVVGVGAPSDQYGHGTHVLSTAVNSAKSEDGTFIGMAPNASRVIVRAFDKNGAGNYANAIRGMNWILTNAARYNIRIVNMSFGSPPQSYYWQDPLAQAVMKLWQAGIVVVAAAGNEGPAAQTIDVPGNVPYVITVGASTDNYTPTVSNDDFLATFSSTGPTFEGFVKPDIVAPGTCHRRHAGYIHLGQGTSLLSGDQRLSRIFLLLHVGHVDVCRRGVRHRGSHAAGQPVIDA